MRTRAKGAPTKTRRHELTHMWDDSEIQKVEVMRERGLRHAHMHTLCGQMERKMNQGRMRSVCQACNRNYAWTFSRTICVPTFAVQVRSRDFGRGRRHNFQRRNRGRVNQVLCMAGLFRECIGRILTTVLQTAPEVDKKVMKNINKKLKALKECVMDIDSDEYVSVYLLILCIAFF